MRELQAAGGAPLTAGPGPAPAAGPAPGPTRSSRRHVGLLALVALVLLAVDVVTKVLVVARLEGERPVELLGGLLLLNVSRNPGAAFSLGQGATLLFTAVALAVVVVILRSARRLRSAGWGWALGLLLGGATGNLVDRLLRSPGPGRGAVVDFIDLRVWPVFNVADSGIVVGALLAVLLSARGIDLDGSRSKDRAASDPSPDPAGSAQP